MPTHETIKLAIQRLRESWPLSVVKTTPNTNSPYVRSGTYYIIQESVVQRIGATR
ncbi:MAG: hypothetical protein ABFS56_22770 [Pseudomonadota bacterium]